MQRHNLFIIHSWDEAHSYARMSEMLAQRDSGLADYSVPPWKAIPGPDDEVESSIIRRIQTASSVVVLNTPGLHDRPMSAFEMEQAVAMGKRIVVLQPHGALDQPIPRVLDGQYYRVSGWRSDGLGRAIRGEYPQDGRVFDIAEVAERRQLVGGIAALAGVGSFLVIGATLQNLKALEADLAASQVKLAWTKAETVQVVEPAMGGAVIGGLLAAIFTGDTKSVTMGVLAGASMGAAYGLTKVYQARLLGTQHLRVLTLEAE
ncbi:TIR domain-containing protein [Myxococcota bacterium]|nr:TIR domain-containing protein [Myxococcota bacterium]